MTAPFDSARWIWHQPSEGLNCYADFRRTFCLPANGGKVTLYISADARYTAFVNGKPLAASQYADYPNYKVYDEVDITDLVSVGDNVLAVIGYAQGEDSSVYRLEKAGVWFAVTTETETLAVSDSTTLCRASRDYVSGTVERFSPQLSFGFSYDATAKDGWQEMGYQVGAEWENATETGAVCQMFPRPIAPLTRKEPVTAHVLAQGVFFDRKPLIESVGTRMHEAALSFRVSGNMGFYFNSQLPCENGLPVKGDDGDGIWLVIDLGREEAGVLYFDIDLPHETTVLVGFGEHLDDGRVRTRSGGRQFAVTYKGVSGRQQFCHPFKRLGCRYVQLHIYAQSATVYYAGVMPTEYPFVYRPRFRSGDSLHNRIYDVSCRTLELCHHEHYEDCPWREQALYAMDSRNQMLFGYYAFGEVKAAQASLRLLSLGMREDGLLELCAPARVPVTIPAFSLCFITGVTEQVMFSGDTAFGEEMLPTVRRILETYENLKADNGLVAKLTFDGAWNFYEWRDGLDGGEIVGDAVYEAPLNAFLALALADAAVLCNRLGHTDVANIYRARLADLRKAMQVFWNEQAGAFVTRIGDTAAPHYAELTQSLLLCAEVANDSQRARLCERLIDPNSGLVPVTLSCSIYKYDALCKEADKYGQWVLQNVADIWGEMLFNGATSFWETELGAWDFHCAGSLCHAWSAVPVYIYCRYLLGEKLDGSKDTPIDGGVYNPHRA